MSIVNRTAFTLVELMVASVIGLLVAVTAVAALRSVTAGRDRVDDNIAAAAALRFAADTIGNDLANLYRDDSQNTTFIGDIAPGDASTGILNINTVNRIKARPQQPEADVYEVEYFLQTNDDQSALMRRLQPYRTDDDNPGGILTVLAENIVAFDLLYYDGQEWLSSWPQDAGSLPQLIEINLAAKMPRQKNPIRQSLLVNLPRWPQNSKTKSASDATP